MTYLADINDPKQLVKTFQHRLDSESTTLANMFREQINPDDKNEKEVLEWQHELQRQLFLISGMFTAFRANLFSLKMEKEFPYLTREEDYNGLLMWAAMEIVALNPETDLEKVAKVFPAVRSYCHHLLEIIATH